MIGKTYPHLRVLNEEGLKRFRQTMTGQLDDSSLDPEDCRFSAVLDGSKPFLAESFETAREMAQAIEASLGSNPPEALAGETGLWAWLTWVLADILRPRTTGEKGRKLGEVHTWYPAAPNDFEKGQRHLVRMPVMMWSQLGSDSDHLICGKPSVPGEVREQLTSQKDMFARNFQKACRSLYYDEERDSFRTGAASKNTGGTARRLAAVRKQLDFTWDMTDLSSEKILALLPPEFNRFKNGGIST